MKPLFAIAPHFQCKGSWTDRLLVAEGEVWRAPDDNELANLIVKEPSDAETLCACLFTVPVHMRTRFWAMLQDEAEAGDGDFVAFSVDLANFLTFKNMTPPKDPVCELLIQEAAGSLDMKDVWALINVGEEPVLLAWPQQQLRLNPGEGCRLALDLPPVVVPPAPDEMNVVVAIRLNRA